MLTTNRISSFVRTALPALLVCIMVLGFGREAIGQTPFLTVVQQSPCFTVVVEEADDDACGDETTPCGDPANSCSQCSTVTITNMGALCTPQLFLNYITITTTAGDDCSIICGCDVDVEGPSGVILTGCSDASPRRVSYRTGFGASLPPSASFSFTICFSNPQDNDQYTIDFTGSPNPLECNSTPCGQAILEMDE